MSSILKALRKLEEEKRGGRLEAPDLRVDQGRSSSGSGRPFATLLAGTMLGAAIVSLLLLVPTGLEQSPDADRNDSGTSAVTVTLPARQRPQTTPVQPALAEQAEIPQQAEAPQQAPSPVSPEPAPSQSVKATVPETAVPAVRPATVPADRPVSKGPGRAVAGVPEAQPTTETVPTAPPNTEALPKGVSLLVSEIFYQDGLNSMAVVNDLPVMVGSHVDSALVAEIRADRVIFEIDGRVYSVSTLQR